MISVTIHTFGAMRKFGNAIQLEIPEMATIGFIRNVLAEKLGAEQRILISESVLANSTDILADGYVVSSNCSLSILPPVCGG